MTAFLGAFLGAIAGTLLAHAIAALTRAARVRHGRQEFAQHMARLAIAAANQAEERVHANTPRREARHAEPN